MGIEILVIEPNVDKQARHLAGLSAAFADANITIVEAGAPALICSATREYALYVMRYLSYNEANAKGVFPAKIVRSWVENLRIQQPDARVILLAPRRAEGVATKLNIGCVVFEQGKVPYTAIASWYTSQQPKVSLQQPSETQAA